MRQPAKRTIFQIRKGSDKKVNNQQSRENYIPGYKKPSHGHNHTKCRYPDPVFIHTLFRYGTYHLFELYHGFYFKSVHLYDEKSCLMYTHAAKKNGWFDEVVLIVWGSSSRLLAEDSELQEKVKAMKKDGVILEACVACANMLGVAEELEGLGIDVKGMGVPLTRYMKEGYHVLTY